MGSLTLISLSSQKNIATCDYKLFQPPFTLILIMLIIFAIFCIHTYIYLLLDRIFYLLTVIGYRRCLIYVLQSINVLYSMILGFYLTTQAMSHIIGLYASCPQCCYLKVLSLCLICVQQEIGMHCSSPLNKMIGKYFS